MLWTRQDFHDGVEVHVTLHAIERWMERLGDTSSPSNARRLIQVAYTRSIWVPNRYAHSVWSAVPLPREFTAKRRRVGMRYRATSEAVLILSGETIITIQTLSIEDLATLLVWRLCGGWLVD